MPRGKRGGLVGGQGRTISTSRPSATATSEISESPEAPSAKIEPNLKPLIRDSEPEDAEATEKEMIELGMRVVGAMGEDDMQTFLDRLTTECPANDKVSHFTRMNKVNWDEVAFAAFGAEECQAAWFYLRTGTRKFRIMSELVQEVRLTLRSSTIDKATYHKKMLESAPGFPKRPPGIAGAFQMFCTEMWANKPQGYAEKNFMVFQKECQELFKSLSNDQQTALQNKAEAAKAEYVKKLKEFSLKHPGLTTLTSATDGGKLKALKKPPKKVRAVKVNTKTKDIPVPPTTPQMMFIQTKLNKMKTAPAKEDLPDLKAKYKRKWNELSERKRAKWIGKCIIRSQNYLIEIEEYQKRFPEFVAKEFRFKKRVSKDDLEVWERYKGKPAKPPLIAFDLFFEDFCKDPQYEGMPKDECKDLARTKWTSLDYYHKEMYKVNLKKQCLEYRNDLASYFESVPDLIKPIILENLPKKYRNYLTSVDKVIEANLDVEETEHDDDVVDIPDDQLGDGVELNEDHIVKKHKKKQKQKADPDIPEEETHCDVEDLENDAEEQTKKKKRKRKQPDSDEGEEIEQNGDPSIDDDETSKPSKRKHARPKMIHFSKVLETKPKVEFQYANKDFTTRLANDVIRGIFDARQNMGRGYSVYYYYAKYVAREYVWIKRVKYSGLIRAAEDIFRTFLSLSNIQKQTFIDQSFDFHTKFTKESRYENVDHSAQLWEKCGFPGEPKPPPKSAEKLYLSEMFAMQDKNPKMKTFPEWRELDDDMQNFYIRKLYRVCNIYLKEYEDFVSRMTPRDMVAYTLDCYNVWENKYMSIASNKYAGKGFIFPLPKRELFGSEREHPPEIIKDKEFYQRMYRLRVKKTEIHHPLLDDSLINAITKNAKRKKVRVGSGSSSDSASEEEPLSANPNMRAHNQKLIKQNEIKRMSMIMYPLHGI